jgi:endo-1,4-beta-D-glucanase Y
LVEAQGFAMVAAAYMGDKLTLDRLYGYYETKLTTSACGLMGWDNSCEGFADQGAATDGDIDVASGLIVAHWQWPDDGYDDKARRVISNLDHLIASCGDTSALYPGCAGGRPWGGCNETDASYYSPGFFRYFAEVSGNEAWRKLADDTHKIRDAAAHPTTGLVPDWQSVSGTAGAGSRKGYYSFDAIRTPYKHALDYLWHGNEAAKTWCIKLTSWAHDEVGVSRIVDGYQLDGSPAGQNHNLAAVGAMAVCSMANSQSIVDAFVAESAKLRDDFWYSAYLGNLYLLAMSGNMWTPEMFAQ